MSTLAIGTEKGAYLIDASNPHDLVGEPLFPGWKVTAWGTTPTGDAMAALGSNWFGPSLHRSPDLSTWTQVEAGPTYPDGHHRKLEQIWALHTDDTGGIWAGVAEAGLFLSSDDGVTWRHVASLDAYPGAENWAPGLGGLAAHHILTHRERMWVGISAAGVMRSNDRGADWEHADGGVTPAVDASEPGGPGFCVHGLAQDPADSDRMWRQDHSGVYRTGDGGTSWERIEDGLPGKFGFPMLRDAASGRLFVVPLEADANRVPPGGRFGVWRSDDDGDTWHPAGTGFPDHPTFTTVLRNAAVTDGDGGVWIGTTGGDVWATDDAGDTWQRLPITTPRIVSLHLFP